MRQAGTLSSQEDATRLAAYLTTLGVRCRVDESAGQWILWIYEENDLPRSRQELAEFLRNPQDPRYDGAQRRAQQIEREAAERERRAAANIIEVRKRWERPTPRNCPLTILMIVASIGISYFTEFGKGPHFQEFMISVFDHRTLDFYANLPEVQNGEVWRLVTPIFVHLNIFHLMFNMFWLYDLGGMIERRRGTLNFALLVIVSAVVSNVGQYLWAGPWGAGMSGVVYALFGYVWMQSRFNPLSGMAMHPNTVFLMIGWLFLCMTGAIGPIGNAAHAVGLGVGVLIGYLPTAFRR